MTRYRVVCANGNDREEDDTTDHDRAVEICRDLNEESPRCGPHRVEEVPDERH